MSNYSCVLENDPKVEIMMQGATPEDAAIDAVKFWWDSERDPAEFAPESYQVFIFDARGARLLATVRLRVEKHVGRYRLVPRKEEP